MDKPTYDMVVVTDLGHSLVGFVRNDPRRPDRPIRHIETSPILSRWPDVVETENSFYSLSYDKVQLDSCIEDYLKQFKG